MYVVFGHHPCPVSIPTFLYLASLSGFWHSATPTSFFVFITFLIAFQDQEILRYLIIGHLLTSLVRRLRLAGAGAGASQKTPGVRLVL